MISFLRAGAVPKPDCQAEQQTPYFFERNPYFVFRVAITDENGHTENWLCEAGSLNFLIRRGRNRNSLKSGDMVAIHQNRVPFVGESIYATTKAAIVALTKGFAVDAEALGEFWDTWRSCHGR